MASNELTLNMTEDDLLEWIRRKYPEIGLTDDQIRACIREAVERLAEQEVERRMLGDHMETEPRGILNC